MLEIFWKAAATRRAHRYGCTWQAAAVLTAILLLTGCAGPPRLVAQGDPSDPGAPTRPVSYRATLGPYQSARPVDPAPWLKQNERVAPPPADGGSR